jgi:hypothetical protein
MSIKPILCVVLYIFALEREDVVVIDRLPRKREKNQNPPITIPMQESVGR